MVRITQIEKTGRNLLTLAEIINDTTLVLDEIEISLT